MCVYMRVTRHADSNMPDASAAAGWGADVRVRTSEHASDAGAYLLGLGGLQVSHLGLQFLQFLVERPLGCLQLCLQLLHLFVLGLEGVLRLRKLGIYRSHLGLQPLLCLLGKHSFRNGFPYAN